MSSQIHWKSLASCRGRHDGEEKTGLKQTEKQTEVCFSCWGCTQLRARLALAQRAHDGPPLLGWAQVGISELVIPHTCQALCGCSCGPSHVPVSWRFVAFWHSSGHSRNCEGYPGAACKFGYEQGVTKQGGACLFLPQWLLPLRHAWHWGAGQAPH